MKSGSEKKKSKVLLIGWDAADWKVIDKMVAAGALPTIKKFLAEGVRGNIATLDPPLSPMLWTSIATGKRADKHGILGFVEPDSSTNGVRPVSSRSRKVKAIWNMLNQKGLKSNVVGWWPSNPVEPINGVMVSNLYQQERRNRETVPMDEWDMPKGTVHPPEWEERMAELRVHPHEITGNLIMPFVPKAVELNEREDKRLTVIQMFIAHMTSVHNACTEAMAHTDWDFMAVYHDAIDHFSHAFMKYFPPKMEGVDEKEFELFQHAVFGVYRFHDMMLERLLNLCDDDTTVIIVSDHGFHSDHLRPRYVPDIPAGPAIEHSPFGVFAAKGPGIKKGEHIFGASILDITPTLLTLFDLPVAADMDGKPLVQIYEEPRTVATIDSWENVTEGDAGMLPKDLQEDPFEAAAALQQLVDLGYIDAPEGDMGMYRENIINENQHYLARTYINANNYEAAVPVLQKIWDNNYALERISMDFVVSLMRTRRYEQANEILEQVRAKQLINPHYLDFYKGKIQLARHRYFEALELFKESSEKLPTASDINLELGKTLNQLQRYGDAESVFRKMLEHDQNNAYAHNGLGFALLRQEKYEEAVDEFLTAVDLIYHYPFAHYNLGETLALMGEAEHAATAFKVALTQHPNLRKAYMWLQDLYANELNDPQQAEHYQKLVDQNTLGEITVVTGLPRSGTSLMMQLLEKGGMEILADDHIPADEHNPNGYYLYQPTVGMATDNSFLKDAVGKAIKIPFHLLPSLPNKYQYRIVMTEREENERLTSLHAWLASNDKLPEGLYSAEIADAQSQQKATVMEWLRRQPNLEAHFVSYNQLLGDPAQSLESLSAYFDGDLDREQMAGAIDTTFNHYAG